MHLSGNEIRFDGIKATIGFYCTYWHGAFVYLFQLSFKRVCVCSTGQVHITKEGNYILGVV